MAMLQLPEADAERVFEILAAVSADRKRVSKLIVEYLRQENAAIALYFFLPLGVLRENALVSDASVKELARRNTRLNFVQERAFLVEEDICSYATLYAMLARRGCGARRDAGKLFAEALEVVDPVKAIDILSEVVILPETGFVYEKVVGLFHTLAQHKEKLSDTFLRNVFSLRNDFLNRFILKQENYSREVFSVLCDVDYGFCRSNFRNFQENRGLLRRFLAATPADRIMDYKAHFDAEVVAENAGKMDMGHALRYACMFKKKEILAACWEAHSGKGFVARFLGYEEIEESSSVFEKTRKLLKRLSLSNVVQIGEMMEEFMYESPVSYFMAVIETVYAYEMLLSVLERLFLRFQPILIDILYFCILRVLVSRYDFVGDDGSYARWYTNLCALLRLVANSVDLEAVYAILSRFLANKRFAHVHVLEIILEKDKSGPERGGSRSGSMCCTVAPEDLHGRVRDAVEEVFLYERFPLQVKVDLCERYRKICETHGAGVFPGAIKITAENIKYLTPCEVVAYADTISGAGVGALLSSLRKSGPGIDSRTISAELSCTAGGSPGAGALYDDFFKIKNTVVLINARRGDLYDAEDALEFLAAVKSAAVKELRVLGDSCLSNLLVLRQQRKKRARVGKKDVACAEDGRGITATEMGSVCGGITGSGMEDGKKRDASPSNIEEGEILDIRSVQSKNAF